MPFHPELYPDNWDVLRATVLNHAHHQCQMCGARNHDVHPETGSRVVLTIAHFDHDVTHNDKTNLAALCQRCHLRHDARQHAHNAAITRRRRRIQAGQQELPVL